MANIRVPQDVSDVKHCQCCYEAIAPGEPVWSLYSTDVSKTCCRQCTFTCQYHRFDFFRPCEFLVSDDDMQDYIAGWRKFEALKDQLRGV
jgi:hypothetical protein